MAVLERETDVALTYYDQGAGEAILFCHGAGGNAASWWQQFGAFAEDYRCVAYDCRGFGRSVCSAEAFEVRKFGGDAVALLDALQIESAAFVCQSMGGWTGVQVALAHPDRITKLVLSDTIGGIALPSGIESLRIIDDHSEETRISRTAIGADYPARNPAGAFLYQQIADFNRVPVDVREVLFADDALVSLEDAKRLTLPILIFSGRDDVIWPPPVLHELAELFPNAQVVDVDSGHSPYFENPDVFNQALRRFLAG